MFDPFLWKYHNPVKIECGSLNSLCDLTSGKSVLLVTTTGFVKRGVTKKILDIISQAHNVIIWDGVRQNPDVEDLDAASRELKNLKVDCVIGLGGGSALDAAKILASTIHNYNVTTLSQAFRNNENKVWKSRLPLIVIPTTSGTGSEVTPFATLWDHKLHKKYSLAGDFVYPDSALLDAKLTLTLGYDETLFPALDSISHALESIWNVKCSPITRSFAMKSLSISVDSLPVVMKDPCCLKARESLQVASVLAGLAISQTQTAIAHSISYPLTSRFGVPHGLACSFTLPALIKLNIDAICKKNPIDNLLINKVLSLLESLSLTKRLDCYVEKNDFEIFYEEMINKERSDNYFGASYGSIGDLMCNVYQN